jgi:DNA-binding GntR family transcriptional regulator
MADHAATEKGPLDVTRQLEEDIALGLLRPRERLVEDDLMRRFGAKRHVVRQALLELEALGIVVRQPNKGAAVRDFTPHEVRDLYEIRELTERRAAELISLPPSKELLKSLKAIHRRHTAAIKAGNLRAVFRENLLFHRTLFSACENKALTEVIELFAQRTHAIRSYAIGDPDLLRAAAEEHALMISAIEKCDRNLLVRVVTQHIVPAKDAYLRLQRMWRPS